MGDQCCRCCVAPLISIPLSVITVAWFVVVIVITFVGPSHESCKCGESVCCVEDEDEQICSSDECFCGNLNFGTIYCQDRDEALRGGSLAAWVVFLVLGILFLIVSSASCCCFGCLKRDGIVSNQTFIGVPVNQNAAAAPAVPSVPTVPAYPTAPAYPQKQGVESTYAGGSVEMTRVQ